MVRSALSKAAWVGRTASMVLGLAFVLGLVVGLADAALGANGQAWVLGQINQATNTTQLNASVAGKAALVVANPNKAPASRALHLNVAEGRAPMAVNSDTRVRNLNADRLDGKDSGAFMASKTYSEQEDYTVPTNSIVTNLPVSCDEGDLALSGGYRGLTAVSVPDFFRSYEEPEKWLFTLANDSSETDVTLSVVCSDLPPLRP